MQIGFVCPDGHKIKTGDCLRECRMGDRDEVCGALPVMSYYANQVRVWDGKPSTTQLINPTWLSYLKVKFDYYVDPFGLVFALIGSKLHAEMETVEIEGADTEEQFEDENETGRSDIYYTESGVNIIRDYKTWGSFAVAKAMGLVKAGKIPDPSGAVYKTTKVGKYTKGDPKMLDSFAINPTLADTRDSTLQLNRYRRFKEAKGYGVDALRVTAFVRDGNTVSARNNGVFKTMYNFSPPIMEDKIVDKYFVTKRVALLEALGGHTKTLKECDQYESWNGKRCLGYCDVWEHCGKGTEIHRINEED